MQWYRRVAFLFQAVTVGLAVAFLVLVLRPELVGLGEKPVVEIRQAGPTDGNASPDTSGRSLSYAAAVENAAPAVVNIFTRKQVTRRNPLLDDPFFRRFFGDGLPPEQRTETSLGSGVIVSAEGYVLTNNHVIEGADAIEVSLHDGRTARASVTGTDPEADLAVLKIDLPDLPTIVFGRSDELRVGDVVLAIGNPFGVGQTVTMGIVSATGRSQLGINTFENFIQTDAAINPGNSGGALVNGAGELVGINTAIFSRTGGNQGIGFAIPVSLAKRSMSQIIETGHVSRGWLGIEVQPLTPELAGSFGVGEQRGVIVAGVLDGGPADRAGVRPGDILVEVAGEATPTVSAVLNAIARQTPGSEVPLELVRDGDAVELEAKIAERPRPDTLRRRR